MIVDVHVHVYQAGLEWNINTGWFMEEIYRPWRWIYDEYGNRIERPTTRPLGSIEALLGSMKEAGVDKALIMTSDHRRTSYSKEYRCPYTPNDYTAKLIKEYPDKFIGMCGLDPIKDPVQQLELMEKCIVEYGMKAVKLFPTYGHYYPADERLCPFYEKAIELDIPITFHMGWTPLINAPMKYQMPHLLDEVGIKFRELKVIVSHLGYPWVDEGIALVAKHPNFRACLSYWITLHPEFILETLLKARDLVGLDRVFFGSEYPICAQSYYVKMFKNLNYFAERRGLPRLCQEDIDGILGNNAAVFLKIKE